MITVEIQRIRRDSKLPERATAGAIGFDVYASRVLDKWTKEVISDLPVEIKPGGSVLIGIGVRFDISFPYEAQVRPRSGLASRYDVELSNSPGTIDPDFRGEAGILLRNRGEKTFTVEKDMRIAQLIFTKAEIPELKEVQEVSKTVRGEGGFGSTGLFEIKKKD